MLECRVLSSVSLNAQIQYYNRTKLQLITWECGCSFQSCNAASDSWAWCFCVQIIRTTLCLWWAGTRWRRRILKHSNTIHEFIFLFLVHTIKFKLNYQCIPTLGTCMYRWSRHITRTCTKKFFHQYNNTRIRYKLYVNVYLLCSMSSRSYHQWHQTGNTQSHHSQNCNPSPGRLNNKNNCRTYISSLGFALPF